MTAGSLGLILCIADGFSGLPAWAQPVSEPLPSERSPSERSPSERSPSERFPTQVWEQGLQRYGQGNFQAAIALWQTALEQQKLHPQHQALLLSYLALAEQQLGQWNQSEVHLKQAKTLVTTDSANASLALSKPSIQARILNVQGRLYWSQGKIEQAQQAWQSAQAFYGEAGDSEGQLLTRLNHAQALMALGFNGQAEEQLEESYQQLQASQKGVPWSANVRATGLQLFGTVLRQIGKPQRSQEILQESLGLIPPEAIDQQAKTYLELGNGAQVLRTRWQALGKQAEAKAAEQSALQFYRQSETLSQDHPLQWQSRLNRLALLVEMDAPEAIAIASQFQTQLPLYLASQPASRATVQAQLNLAESLIQLKQNPEPLIQSALRQAKALADPAAIAHALGQRGAWLEQQGAWAQAQYWTEQALLTLDPLQLSSLRYRWEWQLGRLLRQQQDLPGAIALYRDAVTSLAAIRGDLLSSNPELQFSFRDDVEPVYRELVALLLDESIAKDGNPSQTVLKQAIQQVDALQLAELENFLGCKLAQTVALGAVAVDPKAAKLYPLILDDRLVIILEPPGQQPLQYTEVRLGRKDMQVQLQQLRYDLATPGRTPDAIAGLTTVHDWLIKPFESALTDQSVETLVFVLDGDLRNIPMAALYDGEDYLISRYAVALSPRLQLFDPKRRSRNLSVFLGGVGRPQELEGRSFPAIANLAPELEGIRNLFATPQPLVNELFTKANLTQSLSSQSFSAIHLKTHGVFSSDPEETFVVAYEGLLKGQELGPLLRGRDARTGTPSPVELLVLSACSTAQGDNRAVLGMAGLAVQAGAQSVVSTLWEAQDVPNTALMLRFYEALQNPAISRAEALRSAQLSLLEEGYTTPHVWATYVLVGNWL
ncbi:MAG: CHAT domain-containing protein [Synechococcales cyanobacterium CRU_2_2]|nr:CHAT domain-containing protein [Synechococcales cyanobacterium CRU_2_2]